MHKRSANQTLRNSTFFDPPLQRSFRGQGDIFAVFKLLGVLLMVALAFAIVAFILLGTGNNPFAPSASPTPGPGAVGAETPVAGANASANVSGNAALNASASAEGNATASPLPRPTPVPPEALESLKSNFSSWPTFALNENRTGGNSSIVPKYAASLAWKHYAGAPIYSTPAVVNGKVVFGSDGSEVRAVFLASGRLVWVFSSNGLVRASPVVSNGRVYVGSLNGSFYALNESTGELIWEFAAGKAIRGAATVANGTVYFGSDDEYVYAFNESNGHFLWKHFADGAVSSSPLYAFGRVFFSAKERGITALFSNGTKNWTYSPVKSYAAKGVHSQAAVSENGKFVSFFGDDGGAHFLWAENGSVAWNRNFSKSLVGTPVNANGSVFFATEDGEFFAMNFSNRSSKWIRDLGKPLVSGAVFANDTLFLASKDGTLFSLFARTGAQAWNYSLGGESQSSPSVSDGRVFAPSLDGFVYAFEPFGNQTAPPEEAEPENATNCLKQNLESVEKCYYGYASLSLNSSWCERSGKYSLDCYYDLAVANNDAGLCDKLLDSATKDACNSKVAIRRADANYCTKVANVDVKHGCYMQVAILKIDNALCKSTGELELACLHQVLLANLSRTS